MTSLKLYFSFLYSWHTPKYKLESTQLERILNINKLILNLKITKITKMYHLTS